MESVYVTGHKNPDTDTVVSAVAMAAFLNLREGNEIHKPVVCGKLNTETLYVFNKFGVPIPQVLENAKGKRLFLVDHNEATQMIEGAEVDRIIGFVDHHKIKFECNNPIEIVTKPWGSTNTIIYDLFKKEGMGVPAKIRPLMLCAILSDTVILKSVTTTKKDVETVRQLALELGIDYKELGMEIFRAKAQIMSKSADDIIMNDFKDFDFNGKKFGVGQIEVPDLAEIDSKTAEIKRKMKEMHDTKKYHSVVLVLTDIVNPGSKLLVVSDETDKIARIFQTRIKDGVTEFLPNVMSRKKQIMPKISENF